MCAPFLAQRERRRRAVRESTEHAAGRQGAQSARGVCPATLGRGGPSNVCFALVVFGARALEAGGWRAGVVSVCRYDVCAATRERSDNQAISRGGCNRAVDTPPRRATPTDPCSSRGAAKRIGSRRRRRRRELRSSWSNGRTPPTLPWSSAREDEMIIPLTPAEGSSECLGLTDPIYGSLRGHAEVTQNGTLVPSACVRRVATVCNRAADGEDTPFLRRTSGSDCHHR